MEINVNRKSQAPIKVLFRVDSSANLGCGHMVRCIALAEQLASLNVICTFACRELPGDEANHLIAGQFRLIRLAAPQSWQEFNRNDFRSWAQNDPVWDVKNTLSRFAGEQFSWVIIDHYAWQAEEHIQLRQLGKKILVIDDLCNRNIDADIVVDSGENSEQDYRRLCLTKNARLLLGRQFLPLRKAYADLRLLAKPKNKVVKRILVACGATDPENYSARLLAILSDMPIVENLQVDCALMPKAPFLKEIEQLCSQYDNFSLHINPNMAELVDRCDMALGTAASGCWERCVLGCPSGIFMGGSDQRLNFEALIARGACRDISEENSFNNISVSAVTELVRLWSTGQCSERVPAYSDAQQMALTACDAYGARRIAEVMLGDNKLSDKSLVGNSLDDRRLAEG
jgi:UDP-2,4-diacetamido-2,4,6-trideoxy-beta-L-altropyranose hydrolase